jgi:hypothetical protein
MPTLILNDLNISQELDSQAMAGVGGGFNHGYGVYDHYDQGSWKPPCLDMILPLELKLLLKSFNRRPIFGHIIHYSKSP